MKNKLIFIIFAPIFLFAKPTVTIITSVYNADAYIESFLEDIARQTIYRECEHLIINANSPGDEEKIIQNFVAVHSNAKYIRLTQDPGLYGVWNLAVKIAKADFLINANTDDHFHPETYEMLANVLLKNPKAALVYSDAYITSIPNQTFGSHKYETIYLAPKFSYHKLQKACFIGSHPMWRRELHYKYGSFDERFRCAEDYEFWLRIAKEGAIFKHVPFCSGLNYNGGTTLSNTPTLSTVRAWEREILIRKYQIK